ncbi:hypothetical protein MPTK1_5g00310 [Marchantia polymorpha subsp. ruderalis]|uniref:Cation/H+ exchanger domain-containing protein n=2 Tax=Marchantia polymorpha TaxID=3197 RepID=A0AAF6BDE4_MARPO|nr:hypothetical protein MARPO_0078s0031 [Marchantia polymorpha]BBN10028.1 hypothetical protein Mp_5g00310 [Marchantia polymorpha subsp. ruderalis]|eukprot:PTQ34621.1 hypothetical protein MARPO_0078s0031 [Marchantia polymorpha]
MAMLLVWTLLGLVVGLALGGGLHNLKVSHTAIVLLGYPGELMIRALQRFSLPLLTFALIQAGAEEWQDRRNAYYISRNQHVCGCFYRQFCSVHHQPWQNQTLRKERRRC